METLVHVVFVFILVCVSSCLTYDFRCPPTSQWNFRAAASHCTNRPSDFYTCLWDENKSNFTEYCGAEEVTKLGSEYILIPNPQPVACPDSSYQPFKFTSVGNSQCVYKKSTCSGEGQVIANKGTTTTDRVCRCDYRRSYVFVTPPLNRCTCIPSREDCSCIHKPCTNPNEIMRKDYNCYDIEGPVILPENIPCESLDGFSSGSDQQEQSVIPLGLPKGYTLQQRTSAVLVIQAFIIIFIIILVLLLILLQHVFPVVINITLTSKIDLISKNSDRTNAYNIINGDTIYVQPEIQSFFKVKSVAWQKVEEDKTVDSGLISKESTDNGLYIPNVSSDSVGEYCCTVTNVLGMSNISLPSYFSSLGESGTFKKFAKWFPALQSFTSQYDLSIRVLLSALKVKHNTAIFESDAVLTASVVELVNEVLWINFRDGMPTIIDPQKNPDKYGGCTTADPNLTIKNCSETDAGTYICLQFNKSKQFLEKNCKQWKLQVTKQKKYFRKVLLHRKDHLYVKTENVNKVKIQLDMTGLALITGREGTGKSTLCLEIMSLYANSGLLPVMITIFNKEHIDTCQSNVLYIIDDTRFEEDTIGTLIKEIRSKSDAKNVKMIATCQRQDSHLLTKDMEISKSQIFHLDESLTEEEKKHILQNYIENVKEIKSQDGKSINDHLDKEAIKAIIRSEPWKGFPLTVKQFCDDSQLWKEQEKYFLHPPSSVVSELKNMFSKAKECKGESHDTVSVVKCCVLAYILKHPQHKLILAVSEFDLKLFLDLQTSLFKLPAKSDVNTLDRVKEAANNMVNIYLNVANNVYTFINPCLPQMVLMAAPVVLLLDLFQNGSLQDIMKHVNYDVLKKILIDTSITELALSYERLFRRLTESCFQDSFLIRDIGNFIYRNWIKHNDQVFKKEIIKHLNFITIELVKSNRSVGSSYKRQESTTNVEKLEFRTWIIILLMEEITSHGKDPWIYQNDPSDFIIIFGLVISSKGHYIINCKETFNLLLETLTKKLTLYEQPTILEAMSSGLDKQGNTFFHYLCLFHSEDSSLILDPKRLLNLLSIEELEKDEKQQMSTEKGEKDEKQQMSTEKGGKDEKQLLYKEEVEKDERQHLSMEELEKDEKQQMSTEKGGKDEKQLLSKEEVERDEKQQMSTEKGGKDEKQLSSKEEVERDEKQLLSMKELEKDEKQLLSTENGENDEKQQMFTEKKEDEKQLSSKEEVEKDEQVVMSWEEVEKEKKIVLSKEKDGKDEKQQLFKEKCVIDEKLILSKENSKKNEKQVMSKEKGVKDEKQLLSKKNRQKFGKQNSLDISPLELAAYLGKFPVFMTFLLRTEQSVIQKQRKTLLQITKHGKQMYYGQGKAESFAKHADKNIKFTGTIEDILHPDIAICVTSGKEGEYKEILQKLGEKIKKDELRKFVQHLQNV